MKYARLIFLILILASFVIAPSGVSRAEQTQPPADLGIVGSAVLEGGLRMLDYIVSGIGYFVMGPFSALFDMTVRYTTNMDVIANDGVQQGWYITRDTANLFFIIILIIVALATIFDLENFGAKNILPRLILIALLINFSLTIGIFVIQRANELGDLFKARAEAVGGRGSLVAAVSELTTEKSEGGQREPRGGALENAATDTSGYQTSAQSWQAQIEGHKTTYPANCGSRPVSPGSTIRSYGCDKVEITWQDCAHSGSPRWGTPACADWKKTLAERQATSPQTPRWMKLGIGIIAKLITYPVAAFILLAGSFLMLGRLIALSFILVLAPLAFLSYLIPQQQQWWSEWWSKLFKYAFFYPAFMFCLMLSFLILKALSQNPFLQRELLLSYFIGIAFMFGSIIVASRMGVMGAATVTKFGGKLQGWAKTKAQNAGWRAGGGLAERTLRGPLGARLAGVPIVGAALGRALQPAVARKTKLAEEREKARVSRLGVAAGIGGDYAAGRWARASADDKKEAIDTLKPAQLIKLYGKVGAKELQKDYESEEIKADPKRREKFLSAITDKNKRAEVQTGTAMSGATEFAALPQDAPERAQQTNAMAQVFSNMSDDDIRRMTADEVKKSPQMQAALALMGANTRFVNNFGNEIEKVKLLQDILIDKAKREGGLDPSVTAENLQEVAVRDLSVKEGGVELISSDAARQMVEKWRGEPTLDHAGRVRKIADDLRFNAPTGFTVKAIDDSYAPGLERDQALRRYYEEQARQLLQKSQAKNMDFLQDSLAKTNAQGFHDTFTRNMNIRNSFMRGAAFSAKSGPPPAPAEGAPPAPATPP